MKSLGTLLLAFLVSGFVAGVVQNRLGVVFGAREEFIAVMMLFALVTLVTTLVLGVALAFAGTVAGIDLTAGALIVLAALLLGGLVGAGAIFDRKATFGPQDAALLAEIAVPTMLMILIQWWFVRRRAQRT